MPGPNTDDAIPPGFHLLNTLRGHQKQINRIAWSADGSMLASPSNDYTIRLWDVKTGETHQILESDFVLSYSVAWSPDGGLLAIGGVGRLILCVPEQRKVHRTLPLPTQTNAVHCVAWSPHYGAVLASGADDHAVYVWDLELQKFVVHKGNVYCVAWSPDGRLLASGSEDATLHLQDVWRGQAHNILTGHTGSVFSVAWSPDGQVLASGSSDTTIRIWNWKSTYPIHTLRHHTGAVTSVTFSYDGRLLASKSHDGTVKLWRTDTCKQ